MSDQQYSGVIIEYADGCYTVKSADAPKHIAVLFLRGNQISGSREIGATGKLVYRTSSNSGLWYLIDSAVAPA